MAAILVFTTLTTTAFAHVTAQQRYNDGYNAGQDYAACDYNNCDNSVHGNDMGCPTDKKHTYEYCQGYSLGYQSQWNSLARETTTTHQSQAQAQDGSNVNIDGSHNNANNSTKTEPRAVIIKYQKKMDNFTYLIEVNESDRDLIVP